MHTFLTSGNMSRKNQWRDVWVAVSRRDSIHLGMETFHDKFNSWLTTVLARWKKGRSFSRSWLILIFEKVHVGEWALSFADLTQNDCEDKIWLSTHHHQRLRGDWHTDFSPTVSSTLWKENLLGLVLSLETEMWALYWQVVLHDIEQWRSSDHDRVGWEAVEIWKFNAPMSILAKSRVN